MGNIKLCESEKKTEIISVKCTKQEKCKLERGAAKKGKSLSAYVLEGGLIGRERQSTRDKRNTTHLVIEQEMLNEMYKGILENEQTMKILWENMDKEAQKIWDF